MYVNFFRTAIRNYSRNMNFTILNILGLVAGITVFILILLYIQYELSFDKFNVNRAEIYRVEQLMMEGDNPEKMVGCPAPLGPALLDEFPEIEAMTRVFVTRKFRNFEVTDADDRTHSLDPLYVDQSFLQMFSYHVIESSGPEPLRDPFSILITRGASERLFGKMSPVGQVIENDGVLYTVTGMLEDVPGNSHLQFDALCSVSTFEALDPDDDPYSWSDNWLSVYIRIGNNSDALFLEAKLQHILRKLWKESTDNELSIRKLSDIHLHSDIQGDYAIRGDITNLYILVLVAITVLVMAGVNFMNLSTAQAVRLIKQAAVKKLNGASRKSLILQFMFEALLITVVSMMLAMLLASALLPYYNDLIGRNLEFNFSDNPILLLIITGTSIVLSVISSIFPSVLISEFQSIDLVKGTNTPAGSRPLISKVLITIQFLVSVVLIISATGIVRQVRFLKNMDLGYDSENILRMDVKDSTWSRIQLFRDNLLKNPDILAVTVHDYPINNSTDWLRIGWDGSNSGEYTPIGVNYIDNNFIDAYKLEIVQGEDFYNLYPGNTASDNLVILNETAVKKLNLDDPLGKKIYYGSDYRGRLAGRQATIVGVVRDYNFTSAHTAISPLMLRLLNLQQPGRSISIKITGNEQEKTIREIQMLFSDIFTDQIFSYKFVDDYYRELYSEESKFGRLAGYMSLLAIFIATLGVFGLVSYTTAARSREVGIRKVFGAGLADINWIFTKEFVELIVLAFIISAPVSYLLVSGWMAEFPYKAGFSVWPFILALMLVLVITQMTILSRTIIVAALNPTRVIRSE